MNLTISLTMIQIFVSLLVFSLMPMCCLFRLIDSKRLKQLVVLTYLVSMAIGCYVGIAYEI